MKDSFFPQGGLIQQQANTPVGSGRVATLGPVLRKEFLPNPMFGEGFATRVTVSDTEGVDRKCTDYGRPVAESPRYNRSRRRTGISVDLRPWDQAYGTCCEARSDDAPWLAAGRYHRECRLPTGLVCSRMTRFRSSR